MSHETFLFGARSGVQKGIRRGNLNLTHRCFEALWKHPDFRRSNGKKENFRQWLQWRTDVLVAEDVWYMAGELQRLKDGIAAADKMGGGAGKGLTPDGERKVWKRFIMKLAVLPKNRDAGGLLAVATHTKAKKDDHQELVEARRIVWEIGHSNLKDTRDWLKNKLLVCGKLPETELPVELTDLERRTISSLADRVDSGMLWDRKTFLVCMLLIAMRGLPPNIGDKAHKVLVSRLKAHGPFKSVPLPWYVFDMHTLPGIRAGNAFYRQYGERYPWLGGDFDKGKLKLLWFQMESAWIQSNGIRLHKVPPKGEIISPYDCVWWVEEIKASGLQCPPHTPVEVKHLWKTEIREKLKELVLDKVRSMFE